MLLATLRAPLRRVRRRALRRTHVREHKELIRIDPGHCCQLRRRSKALALVTMPLECTEIVGRKAGHHQEARKIVAVDVDRIAKQLDQLIAGLLVELALEKSVVHVFFGL